MMSSVLSRPKRPLSRRFRRSATPAMRSFAKKRHQRTKGWKREQWKKSYRRTVHTVGQWVGTLRRAFPFVLIGLVILLLCAGLFSPVFMVRDIRILRDQGRVDVIKAQQSLQTYFGKHLLFLSSYDVMQTVKEAVPDLESVEVTKHYPSQLTVRIRVKPLAARLDFVAPAAKPAASGAVLATATGAAALPEVKKQDFLTADGMYISASIPGSGGTLPSIKIVDWEVKPAPFTKLFTADFLLRMNAAEHSMTKEFGQKVTLRTVYLRGQEFHLSDGRISLWFDMQSPLQEEISRYRTFLRSMGPKAAKFYVDLRLKGRVVYR